ncbi:MAG: membrane protein [Planctomycetota bacterium]|nr:MAG: membrane protein [Planctomycetota bacterium]
MEILYALLVGAVIGWLAGVIMKGGGFGVVGNIIIGILGSMLGHFIFGALGLAANNTLGRLLVSLGGAVLLIMILRTFKKA